MDYVEETNALTTAIYTTLIHSGAELAEMESENEGDEMLLNSGKYSSEGRAEIQNEISARNRAIAEKKKKISDSINTRIDEYVAKCTPSLSPAEITDDAKLLTCGVKLTSGEIGTLLERNKGNFTMETILIRYAEENKLDIADLRARYRTAFIMDEVKKTAQGERERLNYAMNHLGKKNWRNTINQFFGVVNHA